MNVNSFWRITLVFVLQFHTTNVMHRVSGVTTVGWSSTATAISFTAATFTVCVICAELPQGSVAVQVMMVWPAGYGSLSPIPSLRVGTGVIAPEQASLAVGVVGMTVAALAVH